MRRSGVRGALAVSLLQLLFLAATAGTAAGASARDHPQQQIDEVNEVSAAKTNHTCAALGCGGHDSVCYCTPTCVSYGDCCTDFSKTCPPAPTPPLVLSDVNIVVTTDMHAWIEGRAPHQPNLNASIAHLVDSIGLLRAAAAAAKHDLFVFDNGDVNDGTGLSASATNHVDNLAPLLAKVPYVS